jgi:hypothetical protein
MRADPVVLGLAFAGWVVAFLLGKQLQTGYAAWCERNSSRPPRS